MNLRDYQFDLASRLRNSFSNGKRRPLIVLPTGGGKTVLFSYIAKNAVSKNNVVWIIAHRAELINQASTTLGKIGVTHGVIKSGIEPSPNEMVQVASVQSLASRAGKSRPPNLIIIDEAHHATASTYSKVLKSYPDAKVIGFTASPCRLDGRGLGDVFDDLIVGPPLKWLTDNGFLSPALYYAPPEIVNLSKIKMTRGDYDRSELSEAMDKPGITGDAVTHYRKLCDGKPMLVFCTSVQHAADVATEYRMAGYRAAHVHGGLSAEDRDDRINGLGNGKYQVIASCDLVGEGLDVPICVAAQLLCATASLVKHLQQIGRVLRVAEGKPHAIILDHVGNCRRHGLACDEREWTLDAPKKKKRNDDDPEILVRSCPECFAAHKPSPTCPFCGFVYPPKPRSAAEIKAGELEQIFEIKKQKKLEEKSCNTYYDFLALAHSRGYAAPVAWAKIRSGLKNERNRRPKLNQAINFKNWQSSRPQK